MMERVTTKKLSKTQKIFLFILFIICLFARIGIVNVYRNIQRAKIEVSAKVYAESVATSISLSLNNHLNTSIVLKELYLEYHDDFIKDFGIISKRLITQYPQIISLYMAPEGIIKAAYPEINGYNENDGIGMLNRPVQGIKAQLAVDTRDITVAGPHKLIEGGNGFIIRSPIFENDEFSGFSIVVLDWDKFVKQILDSMPGEKSGYNFAVWNESDTKVVTDENGYILKSGNVSSERKNDITINIPNDTWHLTVEPVEGWKVKSSFQFELIVTFLTIFVPLFSVYLRQRRNAYNIYIAEHDNLTNLLSRTAFLNACEKFVANSEDCKISIVAADIENFKVNNSMYGTEKCDEVLIYLADKFLEQSPYKLCTRYGSDHFIFIMPYKNPEEDIQFLEKVAQEIMENAPIDSLSVKFGYYGNIDKSVPVNLNCDKALLAAKSILHNYEKIVANYEGPLSIKHLKAQMIESSFLESFNNEDFKIWFQPKYDAKSEKLVGAEALVRWIKNDGVIVSPADFIHIFEEDGLIYKLDKYIFEKVCNYMNNWKNKGYNLVPISINISRNTLQHKNIISEYKEIIDMNKLNTEFVPLEITESSTTANKHIKNLAEDLKNTGFKIHLDDYGSGLSSLESLNLLPFDVIKLDKSLIDFIGTPVGEELLRHTFELIHFMNIKTIAEGVEREEQLKFLRAQNCDYIQGYYFSAPVTLEKFDDILKKHSL